MREIANRLLQIGFTPIPTDGKKPLERWSEYQTRIATQEEVDRMRWHNATGIGFVIPERMEVLDFDLKNYTGSEDVWGVFKLCTPRDLFDRLVIATTRNGGYHVYYYCTTTATAVQSKAKSGKPVIETRSNPGFIFIAPTPGYKFIQGKLTDIPEITEQERNLIHAIAAQFDAQYE